MNGLYDDAIRKRTETTKRTNDTTALSVKQTDGDTLSCIFRAKNPGNALAARTPGII